MVGNINKITRRILSVMSAEKHKPINQIKCRMIGTSKIGHSFNSLESYQKYKENGK